eukprot:5310610-Alexandrium_andersonii.AAC.1
MTSYDGVRGRSWRRGPSCNWPLPSDPNSKRPPGLGHKPVWRPSQPPENWPRKRSNVEKKRPRLGRPG